MASTRARGLRRIEVWLPLGIAGLLLAVVALSSWLAYREVRASALREADERLQDVGRQLAGLLNQSVVQLVTETRGAAEGAAVTGAVAGPPGSDTAGAQQALDAHLASSPQIRAVTLWDTAGTRILAAQRGPAPGAGAGVDANTFPAWARDGEVTVSGFRSAGEVVWFEVAAPVRRVEEPTAGYLVQHRELATSGDAVRLISDLIGMESSFMVGEPGGTWTDLTGVVAPPPVSLGPAAELARYQRAEGPWVLGAGLPVEGTSWMVWVEFPLGVVLAGPRAFLLRMIPLGLAMVLVGAGGGWALSRRITGPLGEVTGAATALSAGDYHRRVQAKGVDELAELGQAFNSMADSLQEALDAAHRSQEEFRHLFTGNPLPMWVHDAETLQFLEVNGAAAVRYGYSRDEFLGMRLTDLDAPDAPLPPPQALDHQPSGRLGSEERRHRLKDGRIIDVEITSHPREFEGRAAALVVSVDITERKRVESATRALNAELEERVAERTAKLQESEERFRTLAAAAHDAILTADAGGLITYFNPGAERMFGYPSTEVLGAHLTTLVPEGDRATHQETLARYAAAGDARGVVGRTVEFIGRRKDGTQFPLELSLASRRVEGVPAFIGIIRDVTKRKESEQAIRRYAADLEAANQDLEAFSYSVSHDLRAPLRSIHGFSQAVLEDHQERLDEQGVDYLGRVCAAAQHMGALIDDLLELSRATRAEMRREPVDLTQLADRVVAELVAANPDREVDVRVVEELTCHGDHRLLTLMLRNLIGNAWKFTSNQDRAVVELGTTNGAEPAYFVRDNGAGFDMNYADKLFQPFQRLHSSREFEGTGIGLALVQRVIHRHGGKVWAEGAVHQGATFYFTLPAD